MKYKNQERYAQRNKEKGLVRSTVWIPKQYEQELKDKAIELRERHFLLQKGAEIVQPATNGHALNNQEDIYG